MRANFGQGTPAFGWAAAFWSLVAGLAILVPVVLIGQASGRSFAFLFSDMAEQAKVNSLTGIMSTLTGMGWVVAATLFGMTAALAGKVGRGPRRGFFVSLAIFSAYLALDDVFLIHDFLAFRYLGIGEAIALLPEAIAAIALAIIFRHDFFGPGLPVLAAAVALLGASLLFDAIPFLHDAQHNDVQNLLEDGLKWLGVVTWAGYAAKVSSFRLGAASRTA